MGNDLYYGDNLAVLRGSIAEASVDLVYLDPPFNSNASYNVLFRAPSGEGSAAQIEAFDDTWHWNDSAEGAYGDVMRSGNGAAAEMLRAMRSFLGENDMMAYLAMMAVRLIELHRVLKPTGSLYLHCDPTASHYLKILLDAVFGGDNYLSEISWKRTGSHSSANRWGPIHDVIHFVSKRAGSHVWNRPFAEHSEKFLKTHYRKKDNEGRSYEHGELTGAGVRRGRSGMPWRGFDVTAIGRHWITTIDRLDELFEQGRIYLPDGGGWPRLIRYADESKGRAVGDIWEDIPPLNMRAQERLGYPTQKPVALLERIVSASSSPGDLVLDPFCGCGTTVHAAEKLGRAWIGIDVTHLAIGLIEKRLRDAFPAVAFTVHGVPQDLAGARDLAARGKYHEFEKWALSLVGAQPGNLGKKGADRGLDGRLYFGKTDHAVVSVKAGENVGVAMIRDLKGVMEREKAPIGVFLTLTPPTRDMRTEAAAAGQHAPEGVAGGVPRLQIVTVEDAMRLRDRAVALPLRRGDTFRRAAREEGAGRQGALDV